MESVDDIGGIPVVMRMLLEGGLLHGDCLTVTGKTVAQNLDGVALPSAAQDVIFPLEKPYAPAMRHIIILKVCTLVFMSDLRKRNLRATAPVPFSN